MLLRDRIQTIAVFMVFFSTIFLPAVAMANTQPTLDFNAVPQNDPHKLGYFIEQAKSGKTVHDAMVVSNPNNYPITVKTMVVGSSTAMNGEGLDYSLTPSTNSWISMPSTITVPAKTDKTVPFSISIPQNASSGEHIFGISMMDKAASEVGSTSSSKMSVQINEQVRRVITVEVKLTGANHTGISFTGASMITMPSGNYLDIRGLSTGNVIEKGISGQIELYQGGKMIWNQSVSNVELAPDAPFEFQYPWANSPKLGDYTVEVKLSGGGINAAQTLSFKISGVQLQKSQQLTGQKEIQVQSFLPTWVYIALGGAGVVVLLVVIFFIYESKRKMKRMKRKMEYLQKRDSFEG